MHLARLVLVATLITMLGCGATLPGGNLNDATCSDLDANDDGVVTVDEYRAFVRDAGYTDLAEQPDDVFQAALGFLGCNTES